MKDYVFDVMEDLRKINRAPLQHPIEMAMSYSDDVSAYKVWDLRLKSNSTEFAMCEDFAEKIKKVAETPDSIFGDVPDLDSRKAAELAADREKWKSLRPSKPC